MFYGQTGTGKTHTFNACWQRIGHDLAGRSISVTFFEILGKKCAWVALLHIAFQPHVNCHEQSQARLKLKVSIYFSIEKRLFCEQTVKKGFTSGPSTHEFNIVQDSQVSFQSFQSC